jgi:hypothetical protein
MIWGNNMARKAISVDIIKALLARSGNVCAFPGCTHPIINEDNKLVTQLCHIEAVSPGGERYNPNLSESQINGYDNLLFMCYRHHVETDDTGKYSAQRVREMKKEHESIYMERPYIIDVSLVLKIRDEIEQYWNMITEVNTHQHSKPSDIKMEIDVMLSPEKVYEKIYELIDNFEKILKGLNRSDEGIKVQMEAFLEKLGYDLEVLSEVPYYQNPLCNRNWKMHNIGVPNYLKKLRLLIQQNEVIFYEQLMQLHPGDSNIKTKLYEKREALKSQAQNAGYND